MSKGFAVYPMTTQPRECAINEEMIRKCIYLETLSATEEDRMKVVGNREEANVKRKTDDEIRSMDLANVAVLTLSFQRIAKIENLFGLTNLTKLCLDNNKISKIENLSHLEKLKVLDLSFNEIQTIENLDKLTQLEDLSLSSNKITAVEGLSSLPKIVSLNLGKNKIENLDDSVAYLHRLKTLKVLVLKGCPVQNVPNYRVKVLAFVPNVRFLDGSAIKSEDIARAREDQRENLLPIDEMDEKETLEMKMTEQEEKIHSEYARYNCPNENRLYDDLFKLSPDKFTLLDVLRSEALISASKELLEHFQANFNEKLKELADTMRGIREKRDKDEQNYINAKTKAQTSNFAESVSTMKQLENKIYKFVPKGVGRPTQKIPAGDEANLNQDIAAVYEDLLEKEAEQFETMEMLNAATLNKWKSDGVDVILQSSFEVLQKLESDFQVSVRQTLDTYFDQKKKRDTDAEGGYYMGVKQEDVRALLESREDYNKFLNEVFELRRKKLEDLELFHLSVEEKLLKERSTAILQEEQNRHRARINEIDVYIESMKAQLK